VLAEIIAQQIEKRTGDVVERRFKLGGEQLAYQSLLMTEIDMYPESTGALITSVIKETPDKDPAIVLERTRTEMLRLAHIHFIGPLGIDDPFVVVIRADDAKKQKVETLSDATQWKAGWDIAMPSEYASQPDGSAALQASYNLPQKSVPQTMDTDSRYKALTERKVNMIIGMNTDGALTGPGFQVLKDDKKAFPPAQMGIIVREDTLKAHPGLEAALNELKGRLSVDLMRKLNAQVDQQKRTPKDVAAEFLAGK
jgi:osmoprotectant transport system substrate-binding protein